MTLTLGSQGPVVRAWQATMLDRYAFYAKAFDGGPLRVDQYFGDDDAAVQREYQLRTHQLPTGVVSDDDLRKLDLRPALVSIHGTGQADPFGIGYPADIARRLLDLCDWRPVGNYPAQAVPMDASADAGEREAARFITDNTITPGHVLFVDYSQGSICGGRVRQRMRHGDLKDHRWKLLGAASIGNPMRPNESYEGNVNPGGHGIDPTLEDYDPRCINLAARGDLYTTCPDGPVGEMERAIFNAVFRRWTGTDSVPEQLRQLITNPGREIPALGKALWNGGLFVVRGTGPHVRYHLDECPGTGVTYYEHAINRLRQTVLDFLATK
ncbi:peptidoglycan-binding domain-containing protein [Mycolicibacterium fortuitum]|uniref:peptidoglycan-binding domain-containing protein n=1 Tax=Mycolicibacterium fortuitum TaxID=1766 RepID=UPI0026369A13|nr:hypothetical protein [Mycolicibacterium fortuitum]